MEQRRSRRYLCRIVVDVHGRSGARSLTTSNVSRHGIYFTTPDPPPERHVVQLTLHTPFGKVRATAWVSRSVRDAEVNRRGAGLQFFSLGAEDKQRWDDFFFHLGQDLAARFEAQGHGIGASFVVKLSEVAKLEELDRTCIERGAMFLVTPVLKPVGTKVALHLVHPKTEEEFVLLGEVARLHTGRPKGVEIRLSEVSRKLRQRFKRFIRTGEAALDELSVRRPEPTIDIPIAVVSDSGGAEEDPFEIDVFDEGSLGDGATFDWDEAEDSFTIDLDIDDEIVQDLDEVTGMRAAPSAEPATSEDTFPSPPTSAEELLRRLGDGRQVRVRCDGCDLKERLEVGPCGGLLGLIADDVPFWDPESQALCLAPRLAPVKERKARLGQLAGPKGDPLHLQVPLALLFEVAALKQAPTSQSGAQLQSTKAIRELERTITRLGGPSDAAGAGGAEAAIRLEDCPCPRCGLGTWTVTPENA